MSTRRRIDPALGREAVRSWLQLRNQTERSELFTAVRFTLEELAARAPGRAVEVRVPPAGAVQVLSGAVHRRGTPPAVVEADMHTWLALVTGQLLWEQALAGGTLTASGEILDLIKFLPLSFSEVDLPAEPDPKSS